MGSAHVSIKQHWSDWHIISHTEFRWYPCNMDMTWVSLHWAWIMTNMTNGIYLVRKATLLVLHDLDLWPWVNFNMTLHTGHLVLTRIPASSLCNGLRGYCRNYKVSHLRGRAVGVSIREVPLSLISVIMTFGLLNVNMSMLLLIGTPSPNTWFLAISQTLWVIAKTAQGRDIRPKRWMNSGDVYIE